MFPATCSALLTALLASPVFAPASPDLAGAGSPALGTGPHGVGVATGPYGLFWSGGRTWLVDAGTARLFSAPGYVTVEPEGALRRFRQRVEAHRPGTRSSGLPAPASRRALWEHVATPARAYSQALDAPEPWPAPGTTLLDERALLQFTGETLTSVRFQRLTTEAGAIRTVIEGSGWETATARVEPSPDGAGEALAWTAAHLPFALDPCMTRPAGRLPLEGPGGRSTPYLLAAGAAPECADKVRALSLAPPAEANGWPPGVVDRRALPGGVGALVLLGERVEARLPALDDLLSLADPCVLQTLRLERGGASASPVDLGGVPALDGFRWLPEQSPWMSWLGLIFAPAERCGAALRLVGGPEIRLDGNVVDWPADALDPVAALCRLIEVGRVWAGGTDLSAEAAARWESDPSGSLMVAIVVRDVEPDAADQVRLLTGVGDITVSRDGHLDARGLSGVRAASVQRASGYSVEVRLPAAALGRPPVLAVAVDDADPGDPPGAGLRLWVAGEPVGERGAQPLPLEVAR